LKAYEDGLGNAEEPSPWLRVLFKIWSGVGISMRAETKKRAQCKRKRGQEKEQREELETGQERVARE